MTNPYASLPSRAFWRSAVAERNPMEITDLWQPRFGISQSDPVITAGSCFAQHIGRALARGGYYWLDAEPAPAAFDPAISRSYNYGIFSFRTGNIYTAALLRQWIGWAFDEAEMPTDVWSKGGRYFDPFRPAIEPNGFGSVEELLESRRETLKAIRHAIQSASVLVFTMGLTESWEHSAGLVYPMCPGTTAGEFDPENHVFRNYNYLRIRQDMDWVIERIHRASPGLRVLLTVSPVPLTASATGGHVLNATTYSKSTLRAVAGDLVQDYPFVDYFPSYEIISAFPFRGFFYEANLRGVAADGVGFVMKNFFAGLATVPAAEAPPPRQRAATRPVVPADDDLVCEEEILGTLV